MSPSVKEYIWLEDRTFFKFIAQCSWLYDLQYSSQQTTEVLYYTPHNNCWQEHKIEPVALSKISFFIYRCKEKITKNIIPIEISHQNADSHFLNSFLLVESCTRLNKNSK